jgi:hypothetical protein
MRITIAAGLEFLLGLFLAACGSGTVIYDEDRGAWVALDDDGGSGGPGSDCLRCGSGDCGLCAMMYDATHRCADDIPAGSSCYELGSLFEDNGEYYVCWSCD